MGKVPALDPVLSQSLSLGREMLKENRTEELETLTRELKETYPHSEPVCVLWARAAQKREDWQAALIRWSQCMQRFPDLVKEPWTIGKARALMELGRHEEAEEAYNDSVQRFPSGRSGVAGLAVVAQRRGDWPTAADRWTRCLERFPDAIQPFWLTGLANARLEQGMFREAARIFGRAVREFPEHPGGYLGLARTADRREELSVSVQRWREVVERFPRRQAARLPLARALLRAGHSREAEEQLDPLLRESAWRCKALMLQGRIALIRQRWTDAVRRCRLLLSEEHDDPAVLNECGLTLGRMGMIDEGLTAIRRARKLSPADHAAWWAQHHLLFVADRLSESRELAEEAVASLRRAGAPSEAAVLLDRLGRFSEAQAIRSELDPSSPVSRKTAKEALKRGRYDLFFQLLLRSPGLADTPSGVSFARELAITSTSRETLRQALAAGRPVTRLERMAARIRSSSDRSIPAKGPTAPLVMVGLSWGWGGAERDMVNLMEGLRSRDHGRPVHLILSPKQEWPVCSRTLFDGLIRQGVRVSHVDDMSEGPEAIPSGGEPDIVTRLFREVRSPDLRGMMLYRDCLAALDPETVVIWGTGFPHLLAGLAALLTNTPRIVYSLRGHGLLAELSPDLEQVDRLKRVMEQLFGSKRVRITACSATVLERHIAETDWDGSNGRVIYPGINEPRLKRSGRGNPRRDKPAIPDSDFCIGGVFRLSWEKCPLEWLGIAAKTLAAAENKRLLFLLVGEGQMVVAVREAVEHLGFGSRCLLAGEVDDVSHFYQRMDLLLHLPRSEGLGNVMVEAQWYGVPVVTANVGGCPETIRPDQSGWVEDRDDPDAVVRRILWCVNSPEAMRRASKSAMEHARERFSGDQAVERYLEEIGLP